MSAELRILKQREIAALVIPEISPAMRGIAASYWTGVLELMRRHHLFVVQTDGMTYSRITALDEEFISLTLIEDKD